MLISFAVRFTLILKKIFKESFLRKRFLGGAPNLPRDAASLEIRFSVG